MINNRTTDSPMKKIGKGPTQALIQSRDTDGEEIYEKFSKLLIR